MVRVLDFTIPSIILFSRFTAVFQTAIDLVELKLIRVRKLILFRSREILDSKGDISKSFNTYIS